MKLRWINGYRSEITGQWIPYRFYFEINDHEVDIEESLVTSFMKKYESAINGTGTNMFRGPNEKKLTKELYKWFQYNYLIKKIILDNEYGIFNSDNVLVSFDSNKTIMGYQVNTEIQFAENETYEMMSAKKLYLLAAKEIYDIPFGSLVLKMNLDLSKMDQTTLAKDAGLTKQEVSRWIKGVKPRRDKQEILAKCLDFDIDEFDESYWNL